jgi:hypothetical protein
VLRPTLTTSGPHPCLCLFSVSYRLSLSRSLSLSHACSGCGLAGNGNGEFQLYVNSNRTAFVSNGVLHVKPALTEQVFDDLQAAGNLFVAKTRSYINNTAQPWT